MSRFPQSLLEDPNVVEVAASMNMTPEQYLQSILNKPQSPILNTLEAGPLMDTGPTVATQPAPVLQQTNNPADRVGEEPGVLMRNEQNLVQENIGERQLLETRIADLEGSVENQEDVARLQQMKQRLVELGGSVESNPSTSQYDAAAQAYLGQLRGQQEQAAEVAPDVRAAEAEIASTTGLLSSGALPPEMMASVQARKAAAEAALVSGNAARDARVADVSGSTLSVDNPVNGMTAQSLGVQLPGQEPGMNGASDYTRPTPVPVDNSGMPSGLRPYTAPTPPTPILAGNEPGMNGASDYSKPVLINTTAPAPTTAATTQTNAAPVLGGTGSTATRTPALSRGAGNMTANARGSALGITPRGESLIRIGGQMYSGALQGDGIGAATREYGAIQDANRAAEVAAAKQAEATRIAELRARGTGSKAAGKEAAKNAKALSSVNDAMYSMQRGLDAIADSRAAGGNLTGIGGIFKGVFDNFTGDADANRRLILSRLKIDDTLLRTAETKGAISNIEMALFLEPAPKNFQDEQIWVDWLNERMRTLRGIQYRLQTGEELPLEERSQRFGSSTAAPSNTGSSNMSAADAIVGI